MKSAKSILYGATALVFAAGSALAVDPPAPSDSRILEEPSTTASTIYEVDEDRDGRTDRLLILDQSDSLA